MGEMPPTAKAMSMYVCIKKNEIRKKKKKERPVGQEEKKEERKKAQSAKKEERRNKATWEGRSRLRVRLGQLQRRFGGGRVRRDNNSAVELGSRRRRSKMRLVRLGPGRVFF